MQIVHSDAHSSLKYNNNNYKSLWLVNRNDYVLAATCFLLFLDPVKHSRPVDVGSILRPDNVLILIMYSYQLY